MNRWTYRFIFAYRAVSRHRLRSITICLCIAFSIAGAVWVHSMFAGINAQIAEAVKDCDVGDFQIQTEGLANNQNYFAIEKLDELYLNDLNGIDGIASVSPEIVFPGHVASGQGSEDVNLIGGDAKLTEETLHFKVSKMVGDFYSDTKAYEVVVGGDFAVKFQLSIGDNFTFHFQNPDGMLKKNFLKVVGIYHKNGPEFERKHIFASEATVKKMTGIEGPRSFNRMIVRINNDRLLLGVQKRVQEVNKKFSKKVTLKTWRDINPEMAVVSDFHDGVVNMVMAIVAITMAITLITPVLMIWQERKSELQMLKTIGIPKKEIIKLGLSEALILGVVSAALALSFITIIISWGKTYGIDLKILTGGKGINRAGLRMEGLIYPQLNIEILPIICCFILVIFFLSYFLGLRKTLERA